MKKNTKISKIYRAIIIPLLVAIFNILIIIFPQEILESSKEGLSLWFNNVLPSLLPFIIGTNLLIGLGVVSFIGTLLEPVMMPLFGVGGSGGYALITGMTSGYPMGVKTVANLRENNQLSQIEAQRLTGFVNNGGPLFIIGVVGVGLFASETAGYFILTAHYVSAIITGLLLKYYKKSPKIKIQKNNHLFSTAVSSMKTSIQNDGRTFGQILSDSLKNSLETIAIVGGYIILFSVVVKIFEITGITSAILSIFALPDNTEGLIVGFLEITNGAKLIAANGLSPLALIFCTIIISFGGLSIHAQSVNFMRNTDIKPGLYILFKLMHAGISGFLAWCLLPFFNFNTQSVTAIAAAGTNLVEKYNFSLISFLCTMLFLTLIILCILFFTGKQSHKP